MGAGRVREPRVRQPRVLSSDLCSSLRSQGSEFVSEPEIVGFLRLLHLAFAAQRATPVPSAASGTGGTEQLCLCPSALPRAAGHGTQHVASRFRNKRWRAGRPPPWRSGEDGAVAQAPPLHPHTPRTPALSAPLCPAPARARALHFQYLLSSAFDPFRLLTDSPAIKGNADLRERGAEDGVARCPAGFGFRAAAGRLGLI